ncbi:MAG: N-acetylmuramoyl-L-alanine amidase [Oscillospiraceae bacterium]|nr:N-acetylmuramoyl-L-alanine amidase [Oscillospiraceae bacterium]
MNEIQELLADVSNYRAGRTQKIKYIVIHYTGNKGDTAKANCEYYHGANRNASAHYFVDENEVWCSVPDTDVAWHCGTKRRYYHPECRNSNSVGVEMCSDWSGGEYVITKATQKRAAELVRLLMNKYGIDANHIVRHYDVTHKSCPRPFVVHPEQWTAFKELLGDEDDMTQEEFDAMMDKYLEERGAKSTSDYAKEVWKKATENGTVNGKMPRGFLTREQFVTVLDRLGLNK